ncbi:hypothetical protein NIES4106_61750 (plasmid) [Fischerella sp. NIES-4106]|nr:hypothetical protein NIES4106_61750 [Fischerella sp. NIES-4106]
MARKAADAFKEVTQQSTTNRVNKSSGMSTVTKPDLGNLQPDNYQSSSKLNGLIDITPDNVASQIPQFDFNHHKVSDPLNPPTTLLQTDGDRERVKSVYQQRANAWSSVKDSFNDADLSFQAQTAQVKAIGSGVKLANETEKTKGNVIDYLKTVEDNKQKYVALSVSQYKTANVVEIAPYTRIELDSGLGEAQNKAVKAQLKVIKSSNELEAFRQQLGESKDR